MLNFMRKKEENEAIREDSHLVQDAKDDQNTEEPETMMTDKETEEEYIDRNVETIVENFTEVQTGSINKVRRGLMEREDFEKEIEEFLLRGKVPEDKIPIIIERFNKYVWGYYILDDLINDESISDIKVINEKNIRIKRNGKRFSSGLQFKNAKDYKNFVSSVAVKNKTNLSDINAIQTFTDKVTNPNSILRFNISSELVNSSGLPYLHIRKIPKVKRTKEELISLGMFDEKTADYLIDRLINGEGMFFTGKGASGKTTLMNFLIDYIPSNKSGLAIQENEELFSETHPDIMFQHLVESRGEGKIKYTLRDLTINGLLTDLDYFIIGEIKGGEAADFLNASYTGHVCLASGDRKSVV